MWQILSKLVGDMSLKGAKTLVWTGFIIGSAYAYKDLYYDYNNYKIEKEIIKGIELTPEELEYYVKKDSKLNIGDMKRLKIIEMHEIEKMKGRNARTKLRRKYVIIDRDDRFND